MTHFLARMPVPACADRRERLARFATVVPVKLRDCEVPDRAANLLALVKRTVAEVAAGATSGHVAGTSEIAVALSEKVG